MHRTGHYGASLVAYAPVGFAATILGGLELAAVGGVVAVGLSMFPDIDMRLPGVEHRGITHTVHFAVAVGGLVGLVAFVLGVQGTLAHGFVLGGLAFVAATLSIGSHIAADALTPMGVDPFLTGERVSYEVTRAANPIANYTLLALGVVAAVVAVGAANRFGF